MASEPRPHLRLATDRAAGGDAPGPGPGSAPIPAARGAGPADPAARAQRLREWHARARAKWPEVPWGLEDYAHHVGREDPPFPIDLFLGGAAGHRVDPAWAVIEEQVGPAVCRILRDVPRADCTPEELWSEARTKLMDRAAGDLPPLPDGSAPAKIITYRGRVALVNLFVVVARRVAIQRDRRRKPMDLAENDDGQTVEIRDPAARSPADSVSARDLLPRLRSALAKAFADLTAEQQFLLAMVFRNKMKQKDVGKMLGWTESTASRRLGAALEILRKGIQGVIQLFPEQEVAAAWEQCVGDLLQAPANSPAPASPGRAGV